MDQKDNSQDSTHSVELRNLEQESCLTKVYDEIQTKSNSPLRMIKNSTHERQSQSIDKFDKLWILHNFYDDAQESKLGNQRKTDFIQQNRIQQVNTIIPIMYPNTMLQLFWKGFIAFLVIFFFFEIPIYIAFSDELFIDFLPNWSREFIITIVFTIFVIDIILEFYTAYYKHGNLITNQSMIARNYLQSYFYFDLIATLTLLIHSIVPNDDLRWIDLLFFFKTPSLNKIDYQFEEAVLLHRKLRTIYNFTKVILVLQFCFVIYACAWYTIGDASVQASLNSWLLNDGNFGIIGDKSAAAKFFFSFYFSVGTMTTTMGYGDITPLNMFECACGIVGILFAVIIFAIMVNFLFKIIEEYTVFGLKTYRSRVAINRFMVDKEVPQVLKERIRQFLNEHWHEEGGRDPVLEQSIIQELAPELRQELTLFSFGKILIQIPLFNSNFSNGFLKVLAQRVQECNVSQGEYIFYGKNDSDLLDDYSIYFINTGRVAIMTQDRLMILKQLYKNDYFGEWSFLTGMPRKASAQALNYSQTYKIQRSDFLDVLMRFNEDFEKYWMIRDELLYCKDYGLLGQCWTCQSNDHYCTECDVTHYIPKIQDLIKISMDIQERRKFKRRIVKKSRTFKNVIKLNINQNEPTSRISININTYNKKYVIHDALNEMDQAFQFNTYNINKNYNNQLEFSNLAQVQKKQISRLSIYEPTTQIRFRQRTHDDQAQL